MAWANSKIFRPLVANVLTAAEAHNLGTGGDTVLVALFNDTITPDNDVTTANSCYGAGVWASGEVFEAGQWAQAGVALSGQTIDSATADVVFFDATDTASGSTADLASVYGCLVYNGTSTTPDDQGVCYNYFGGSNSVTNGTFTVVWNTNGIFRVTL